MSEEVKKPIWKKWWFWGIVIVILIGIGSQGGDKAAQTTAPVTSTPAATAPTSATTTPAATKQAPANNPGMSKAEFDQLKSGMTYEQATAIIGGPGEVLSESGNKGEALHTVMYQYKGEKGLGANANLMFQGNKLNNKAQFGLE
jgi:hypothetical protein